METLSNLLWAANGINRPESGRRTAPTARNCQEIELYVFLLEGVYYYEPTTHSLKLVVNKDLRAQTGTQPFCAQAPLNIVLVADYEKMGNMSEELKQFYSATDAGFVSQNIYLFCASEGLNTVVRGSVDRENLSKVMGLKPTQKIILAQTVGYPPN